MSPDGQKLLLNKDVMVRMTIEEIDPGWYVGKI